MARINILSKDIYNKIAAGEVVEKPASVVKELVENSIDAGATNITIEVLEGGITQIKVSDNGHGIDYDDFDKVFLAHATSKVREIDDLSKIGTLGFRGEALSSIASVSKITLSSKTEDAANGYQVKVTGGEMGEIMPIGATVGTYIIVEDLFFNIPARKKFLRKTKLEENDITNYIARLILANPNISFKYLADNKIIYQSFGSGLYDAIYAIYGKSIVDNIFEVNFEKDDFKFSGFIGKPTFSKPNRTYQTLIVNGRYVINQSISTAIYKAFENFLMKGTFPFFVLNLEIPLDRVDVNVHPNKLEVKFDDQNNLFGLVYSKIIDILYNQRTIKKISLENSIEDAPISKDNLQVLNNIGSQYNSYKENNNASSNEDIKEVNLSLDIEYESNKNDKEIEEYNQQKNIAMQSNDNSYNYVPFVSMKNAFDFKIAQNNIVKEERNEETEDNETYDTQSTSINQDNFLGSTFKIIGVLFSTYILVEKDNLLLLFDQHAAHERVIFDKFIDELNNQEIAIQPLIVPYVLETNYNEATFINDNIGLFAKMGFEIECFGSNSFKISSTPLLFENINIEQFFINILSDINNKLLFSKDHSIRDYIAKKACKSAVKGNTTLTENEINQLLNKLNNSNQILLCPHGRPIVVEVSKNEIEKWFKRIV